MFVPGQGGQVKELKEGRSKGMVGDRVEGTRSLGKGWRVAICEPDALTRRAIENIFENAGFVVMSAADIGDLEGRMPDKKKGSPPPVIVTDAGCVNDPDQLPEIVRLVGRGYSLTSPGITAARTVLNARVALSTREKQIVKLVAQGLTNAQIAERLSVSMHTAKEHVATILRKQGLRRRIDLAAWAHEHGIANGSQS
jgi:DNA-binding CsgD family transcriptional regulator